MSHLPVLSQNDQIEKWIDGLSQLPIYTIGRKADNSMVLSNGKVSGQHARLIQCSGTRFLLEDLSSKNGTFVNEVRIARKLIDPADRLRFADADYSLEQLLVLLKEETEKPVVSTPVAAAAKNTLDFTRDFAELQPVFEQYPKLRRACRNREKMVRTGSVILSSIVGISAMATSGGTLPILQLLSSAGLGMLIPTLCSTLLSTDEKLEIIDKEFRERYRCPNPACRDSFGMREWEQLAQQKTCRRCQAIWVH